MKDLNRNNLIDLTAVQAMSDEMLDRLLAEAGEIAIPEDLSFDAQEIMRLAMESESNQSISEPKQNVVSLFARKNFRRYAGLAAAFVVLIGAGSFGMSNIRMGSSSSKSNAGGYQYTFMEANSSEAAAPADMPLEAAEIPMALAGGPINDAVEEECIDMGKAAEDFCRIIIKRDEEAAALLNEALEDEEFAEELDGVTEGGRFEIIGADILDDSIEFMIYLYDGPQDGADGSGYAYNLRYITWIRK